MSHSVQRRWYPIAFAIAALVLLPLSVLGALALIAAG